MQLDGSSPRANSCFGDSGGPALMRFESEAEHRHRHGHHPQQEQKVVGVSSWTGDFCEDFSYYVRLDQVAPFVMREAWHARQQQ